jgi:hypothetical protein
MQIMGVFEMSNEISLKEKSDSIHIEIMGLKLKSDGSLIHIKTDCLDKYNKEYAHYYKYERSEKYYVGFEVHVNEEKVIVCQTDSIKSNVQLSFEEFSDTEEAVIYIKTFLI